VHTARGPEVTTDVAMGQSGSWISSLLHGYGYH
jgi:hypothetical protein